MAFHTVNYWIGPTTNIGQYCSDTGHTIIFYLMWMLPIWWVPPGFHQTSYYHSISCMHHYSYLILLYFTCSSVDCVLSAIRCYKSITYHPKEHNSKFQLIEIEETVAQPSENLEKFFQLLQIRVQVLQLTIFWVTWGHVCVCNRLASIKNCGRYSLQEAGREKEKVVFIRVFQLFDLRYVVILIVESWYGNGITEAFFKRIYSMEDNKSNHVIRSHPNSKLQLFQEFIWSPGKYSRHPWALNLYRLDYHVLAINDSKN